MTKRLEIAKGARKKPGPFARIEDAVEALSVWSTAARSSLATKR